MITSFFLKSKSPPWKGPYLIIKKQDPSPELQGWSNPSRGGSLTPTARKQATWSLLFPWCGCDVLTLTLNRWSCRSRSLGRHQGSPEVLQLSRWSSYTTYSISHAAILQGSTLPGVHVKICVHFCPLGLQSSFYFWSPGVLPVPLQGEQTLSS